MGIADLFGATCLVCLIWWRIQGEESPKAVRVIGVIGMVLWILGHLLRGVGIGR